VLFKAKGKKHWQFTFDIDLAPGEYLLEVPALDKSGNKEATRRRSFTVR